MPGTRELAELVECYECTGLGSVDGLYPCEVCGGRGELLEPQRKAKAASCPYTFDDVDRCRCDACKLLKGDPIT